MQLYRYEIEYTSEDGGTRVDLRRYIVYKETASMYFIRNPYSPNKIKRIRKSAYNTFAYDTEAKAKEHFIRRTQTRIRWFEYWKRECETALEIIKEEQIDF